MVPATAPPAHTPDALLQALTGRIGRPVHLTLTHNRRTWLSFRQPPGAPLRLRLHACFLDAGAQVLDAVAAFIRGDRRRAASDVLRAFYRDHVPQATPRRRRPATAVAAGEHHHLTPLFVAVLDQARGRPDMLPGWDGAAPAITWGRREGRGRGRHIRLGSYDFETRRITIHPALDRPEVPATVLRHVIHHEMLHHVLGIGQRGSRRILHPPAFRVAERASPDHDAAQAWIEAQLPALLARRARLSRRPGGTPAR